MTGEEKAAVVERFQEGDRVELAAETPEAHDFGDGYGSGPFIVKQVIPRTDLECLCGTPLECGLHAFPEEDAQVFVILADESERLLGRGGIRVVFPASWFMRAALATAA